jgi:hypothetical protein
MMFAAVGVLLACASVGFGQKVGGYKTASVEDQYVVAAADFAVSDHSQKNSVSLEVVAIQKAERQTVQGANYRLCIEVKVVEEGNDDTQFVQVVVYQNLKRVYKLISWKPDACGK